MPIPPEADMLNPILKTLRELGGSASVRQIDESLIAHFEITDEELAIPRAKGLVEKHNTKFSSQAVNARTMLRKLGLIENTGYSIWKLTWAGKIVMNIHSRSARQWIELGRALQAVTLTEFSSTQDNPDNSRPDEGWMGDLLQELIALSPRAFERLVVKLLIAMGFINVQLTPATRDRGVDCYAIYVQDGLFRIPVVAQAKRYRGTVPDSEVRDFRGAVSGRAKHGILITTGTFSQDAVREADRLSDVTIRQINGNELLLLLKQHSLGVLSQISQFEEVVIDVDWFRSLEG